MSAQWALVARIWRQREYRSFLILMLLISLATSSGLPLIALYLVHDMGVGLSLAGLFFTGMALPGLALGLLLGQWSDRWRSRFPFIRGATAWVGMGWLILGLTPIPWLAMSVGAVFLSLSGALMGQIYAALRDVMTQVQEPQPQRINTTIRTAWSCGFVVGPVLGSVLATVASFRVAFIVAAALYLVCLVPLQSLARAASGTPASEGIGVPLTGRIPIPLLAFATLCAFVLSGQTIRNTYLPLHVTMHLGGSVAAFGVLMSVSPVIELVALPLAGVLAERIGPGPLIGGGLVIAAVEYCAVAMSSALWQVFVTQALDACVVAVVLGLGLSYAQQLSPDRPGLASSLYFSAANLARILGGLFGSLAVPVLGVPHVFLLPAVLCAVCALVFVGIEQAGRAHSTEAAMTLTQREGQKGSY